MKKFRFIGFVLVVSAAFNFSNRAFAQDANNVVADEKIKTLEEKVNRLERVIEQLEKPRSPQVADNNSEARIDNLEEKQKILERQLEIEREAAAEKAKTTPIITANPKDGFAIKSPDSDFSLRLRGLLQADSRSVHGKQGSTSDDTFLLRRARPIFEGTVFKDVDYKFVPEFGEGKTSIQDAYLDFKYFPQAKLQAGRFKVPFGIERLQSSADTLFTELALSGNLTPNYDLGAALHSESLFGGKFSYAVGVFNGAVDNGSIDSDVDGNKELAARVFFNPWKGSDQALLEGLGFGVATTFGPKLGNAAAPYLPSYKTFGQSTFYSYASDAIADGDQSRYSPQAYYSYGSFGVLTEYITSTQAVSRGAASDDIQNRGWQVAASYVLTGEAASYKGVVPKTVFSPAAGTWGAVELVGRLSRLDIDDDAFPTFADPSKSASSAQAIGAGVNWYWNKNVKWALDYERTSFTGGGADEKDRQDENAVIARVQLSF